MQHFLEELKISGFLFAMRFIGVFLLSVFALLALGTEVVDVFKVYFHIFISPGEALSWVAVVYFSVLMSFLFGSTMMVDGGSDDKGTRLLFFFFVFGVPAILIFLMYSTFHPLPVRYVPGELESRKSILRFITVVVILLEATGTAYFDLKQQLAKNAEPPKEYNESPITFYPGDLRTDGKHNSLTYVIIALAFGFIALFVGLVIRHRLLSTLVANGTINSG